MNQPTLGRQIRALRLLRGLHQADLANLAGFSRPTLVAIERDHVLPTPEKMTAIEAALGISFSHPDIQAAFAVLAGGANGRA